MSQFNDILGLPHYVEGIGDVYPVKVLDYEKFSFESNFLRFTKKHFNQELVDQFTLFELLVGLTLQDKSLHEQFLNMLKTVTGKDFELVNENNDVVYFKSEDSKLDNDNFDKFRETVMKQNLIYEDKVFKNKTLKQWADKVLKTRQKNSVDMTMEDMISVVKIYSHDSYQDIAHYTIYQLQHTFQRILKVEDYHKTIQFMCAGDDGQKPSPFMEKIELYKSPYDDVFVDKGKLSDLDQAMN